MSFSKEKAEKLVDKMLHCYQGNIDKYTAKQCALIAVDEIINEYIDNSTFTQPVSYRIKLYKLVKSQIQRL